MKCCQWGPLQRYWHHPSMVPVAAPSAVAVAAVSVSVVRLSLVATAARRENERMTLTTESTIHMHVEPL